VDPGVSWYLVDADSQQQTEFKAHKDWCHVIMKYQKKMVEVVQKDTKDHEEEWSTRPSQPSMEMNIIEGRKMEELPKGPEFYHPPAPEGFFRSLMPHNGVTR
jgi:hypothetical protein